MSAALRDRALQALEGVTEGPWAAQLPDPDDDWADEESAVYLDDGGALGTAYIAERIVQGDEGKADAQFIAAAPDLVRDFLAVHARLAAALTELTHHGDLTPAGKRKLEQILGGEQ